MYTDIILTLIFLVLLWIALGLQVMTSSIVSLGKLIRFPTVRKLRQLERNKMPFVIKLVAVKVVSHFAIRYITRRIK